MSTAIHNSTTQADTVRFLDLLMSGDTEGRYANVWTIDSDGTKTSAYALASDTARLADLVARSEDRRHVAATYISTALADAPREEHERFRSVDTTGLLAVHCDIDIAGPAHADSRKVYPPSEVDALRIANSVRSLNDGTTLAPTMVVHSGHGIQCWWVLTDPWVDSDRGATREEHHAAMAKLVRDWVLTLRTRAWQLGQWDVDSTIDLARVLRVPGAINRKIDGDHRPVRLLHVETDADGVPVTYEVDELRAGIATRREIEESGIATKNGGAASEPERRAMAARVNLARAWAEAVATPPATREPDWFTGALEVLENPLWREAGKPNIADAWRGRTKMTGSELDMSLAGYWWTLEVDTENERLHNMAVLMMCARLRDGSAEQIRKVDPAYRTDYVLGTLAKIAKPKDEDVKDAAAPKQQAEPARPALAAVPDLEEIPAAEHAPEEAAAEPEAAPENVETTDEGRPQIVGRGRDLDELMRETGRLLALAELGKPTLFTHGRDIVTIGGGALQPLKGAAVAAHFAKVLRWVQPVKPKKGEEDAETKYVPMDPHPLVIGAYLEAPALRGLPAIDRVSRTPYFTPSGRLVDTPGFDREAKVAYIPTEGVTVPAISVEPTADDVTKARELLATMYQDFCFTSDAERAGVYALGLTCYMSKMVKGPAPIFAFDAPNNREGKGLCMSSTLRPTYGNDYEVSSAPTETAEWEKKIISTLRTGTPVMIFDNLNIKADSGALASAVTSYPYYGGRLLGKNEDVRLPAPAAWVVTGKNISGSTEIIERMIRIRLDSGMEKPGRRTGFAIKNLDGWVIEHQGELAWAWCTLIAAWIAAGQPKADTPTFGGFEAWVNKVGSVLAFHGITGLLDNRDEFAEQADDESAAWAALFAVWIEQDKNKERNRRSVDEILDMITGKSAAWEAAKAAAAEAEDRGEFEPIDVTPAMMRHHAIADAPIDLGGGNELSMKQKLGKGLFALKDQRFGNHVLKRTSPGNKAAYELVPVD